MTNSEEKAVLNTEPNTFWSPELDSDFVLNLSNLLSADQLEKEDFDWLGFDNLHLAGSVPPVEIDKQVEFAGAEAVQTEQASQHAAKKTDNKPTVCDQQGTEFKNDKEIELFIENSFKLMNFKQKQKKSDKKIKKAPAQYENTSTTLTTSTVNIKPKLKRQRNQHQKPKKPPANNTEPDKDLFLKPNSIQAMSKANLIKTKNVDLHIDGLDELTSQLDLHSSEDDCELFLRKLKREPSNKKSVCSSTTRSNSSSGLRTSNGMPASNNNNEVSKRTKYSSSSEQETTTTPTVVFIQPSTSLPISQSQLKRKKLIELNDTLDTLDDMKNLNLNHEHLNCSHDKSIKKKLWNFLKENATKDEMLEEIGSVIHDKLTFWDLAKLKLKHGESDKLKITYGLLDDYTLLYSNMNKLLENFVHQQSASSSPPISSLMSNKRFHFDRDSFTMHKSDNSSRSRSSSRNYRKQQQQQQQQQQFSVSTLSHQKTSTQSQH